MMFVFEDLFLKILTVGISESVARIGTDSGQTFGPIMKLAN